jgi:hypothetical protein
VARYCDVPLNVTPFVANVGLTPPVAFLPFPDLSFQTDTLFPDRVMDADEVSAASNHKAHPVICVGVKMVEGVILTRNIVSSI